MSNFESRLAHERDRLLQGAPPGRPGGLGTVRFIVRSEAEPMATVLSKAREALLVVNQASASNWPTLEEWGVLLPSWFVSKCRAEWTPAEIEDLKARRQSQTWDEYEREEAEDSSKPWPLSGWLYWFQEEQRAWFWWDAASVDRNTGVVAVEVDEWPFPWDALSWLLRASGADDVAPQQDESD
jgi:hypothetical protein